MELGEVLDALIDHVAMGTAVRNDRGEIIDFVIDYMNAASVDGAGRSREELVGRRVLELFPGWADSGLLEHFRAVVDTGITWSQERYPYVGVTGDGTPIDGYWSMRVVRFGDGYLAASRDVTAAVAEEHALRAAQLEADANRMAIELLQRAALPSSLPDLAGLDLGARYQPASTGSPVGGDWFDLFPLGDDRLGVVIADVAGHGADAAALMVQVRNYVRALAVEHEEPGAVLTSANRVVCALDEGHLFATCLYGVVEVADRSFSWATAGHLPPLRVGSASDYLDASAGPPLGVEPTAEYAASRVALVPGDRLVLYTDGLVEARGQSLGQGLDALLARAAAWDGLGANETADAASAGAPSIDDDVAVVCIRLAPAPGSAAG